MIIAAVSDVHSPKYYDQFVQAVENFSIKPDLFLMAGDMVHRGSVDDYEKIYNALFGKINCPIVACFGNSEFDEIREEVRRKFREIKFLDDQSTVLEINKKSVGIFGTTGSLERPTQWQLANVPNIGNIFRERIDLVDKNLEKMNTNFKILLIHYAPTFKTLGGENPNFYSSLGSNLYENVIIKRKPNLVVHGHSHKGINMARVDSVPVVNVSFPVNQGIVVIDTEKTKTGLEKFV